MTKKLALVLLCVFLLGLIAYVFLNAPVSGRTAVQSGSKDSLYSLVDINMAGEQELESLPSIGPSTAKRIIDYRDQNGGFKNTEELTKVKGIGKKIYEKLKDKVSTSAKYEVQSTK